VGLWGVARPYVASHELQCGLDDLTPLPVNSGVALLTLELSLAVMQLSSSEMIMFAHIRIMNGQFEADRVTCRCLALQI
jgi:hypothetical protein